MQLVQRRRFATNRDGMWAQLEAAALATIGPQPDPDQPKKRVDRAWLPADRKGWIAR
jgi:hypothetical protein